MLERVVFYKENGTVTFTLVDHLVYEGTIVDRLSSATEDSKGLPVVTYTMDLTAHSPEAEKSSDANWFINAAKPEMIFGAVLHLKSIAESVAKQEAKA